MKNVENWLALFESEDLGRARMVATCLSAMEFDVHLCCTREHELAECEPHPCGGPYAVHVPPQHFSQLVDVIDEILDEQEQFDLFMDRWHARSRRAERRLLLAMVVIVGTLAAVGAIEL